MIRKFKILQKQYLTLTICSISHDFLCTFIISSFQGRAHIFKIHARSMSCERDIRFELLARLCPNCTGAEVRSVCTEAGMFAIRSRRKVNFYFLVFLVLFSFISTIHPIQFLASNEYSNRSMQTSFILFQLFVYISINSFSTSFNTSLLTLFIPRLLQRKTFVMLSTRSSNPTPSSLPPPNT